MIWLRHRTLLPLLIILLPFLAAAPIAAQDAQTEAVRLSATAGFDGFYKGEFWVPVQVTVANNGPEIEGRIQINVGSPAAGNRVAYTSPVSLPTRSNKRLMLYVFLQNLTNRLTVELLDDRERVISAVQTNRLDRLAGDDLLYGVVSSDPDELLSLENVPGERSDAAVGVLELGQLPNAGPAWNALDILVLHDVDTGLLEAAQMEALRGWVNTGGQLVVVGGPGWQKTTPALEAMLPVTINGSVSVDDLPVLRRSTDLAFRDPGPYLVTDSRLSSGEILFQQDGLPLLARRSFGRGAVYFLALDPNLAPLVDWDGRDLLWAEVATAAPRLPVWGVGAQNSYSAGTAVASLPSLALPSVLQLVLFLLVYVVVIGPVNYFALRRLKRRELAWLTIPGIVIVFSGMAYLTGFQLKGNNVILNQMSVAFGRTDGEQLRIQSLLGLYSPRRATYELELPAEAMVRPFDRNFGGLSGGGNIGAVERGSALSLTDVRVDVSDVGTFVADSYRPAPAVSGLALLRMDGSDFKLDITIQNNGATMLEDASLLLGSTAIGLGDLEPGKIDSRTQSLARSQLAAVTGGGAGVSVGRSPSGPSSTPLVANYGVILGSANYYDDRDVYARWQLLQAIAPEYGPATGWYPDSTATLIAWTEEPQLNIEVDRPDFDIQATTVYFLEIPVDQSLFSGRGVTVPKLLLNWQVLDESGVFSPSINDLYLPPGWIELEYQPWSGLRNMTITDLDIMLVEPPDSSGQRVPRLQLWDWGQDLWVTQEDVQWGNNGLAAAGAYIGPGNAVRIRLQNNEQQGIDISEVYPKITGNVE